MGIFVKLVEYIKFQLIRTMLPSVPTVESTILLATLAHFGQKDKVGKAYIFHPLRIMLKMHDDVSKMVALLHDVLEDTAFTAKHLELLGYSKVVVDNVVNITKVKGETYAEYLLRVKSSHISLAVKKEDLLDNLHRCSSESLDEDTRKYLHKKYTKALKSIDH